MFILTEIKGSEILQVEKTLENSAALEVALFCFGAQINLRVDDTGW